MTGSRPSVGGLFKWLVFSVLAPIQDKLLDGLNILLFYNNGQVNFAMLTILMILLPGILEVFYWLFEILWQKRGLRGLKFREAIKWIMLFGPITFPLSFVIWHGYTLLRLPLVRDERQLRKSYAQSKVLKSLQAFSESALQLLLQATILMRNFETFDKHFIQIMCAFSALLLLTTTSADHHHHELSGKSRIPRLRHSIRIWPTILVIIVTRVVVMALLAAYLRYFVFVLISLIIMANWIIAYSVLRTDASKNVWTSVASILVPVCFISTATVEADKTNNRTAIKFYKYYKLNAIIFGLFSLLATGFLHYALNNGLIEYDCQNLPFLSCFNDNFGDQKCDRRFVCSASDNAHGNVMFVAYPAVVLQTMLNVLFLGIQRKLDPKA